MNLPFRVVDTQTGKDGRQLWEGDLVLDGVWEDPCEIVWHEGAFMLKRPTAIGGYHPLHDIDPIMLTYLGNVLLKEKGETDE